MRQQRSSPRFTDATSREKVTSIEVSLLDSAFAALVNVAANALLTGEEPLRYGNAHPSIVPYQPFRAADGWIAVAAANDGLYARLCTAIERPDLAADERYATNEARVRNRESLIAELQAVFAGRSTEEWERRLLCRGRARGKDPRRRRGAAHWASQDSTCGSPNGRRGRAGRASVRAQQRDARTIDAAAAARAAHGRGACESSASTRSGWLRSRSAA